MENFYLYGTEDFEKDYQKAKYYFLKSSDGNDPDAFYYLGKIYYQGLGVEKNYKIAREYFESSAKYFNKKALYYLGKIFENGEGVKIDLNKSIEYYRDCAQNHDEIFINYGPGGWDEDVRINNYYYCSNNILGILLLTGENFQDEKTQHEAEEYIRVAGLNQYPFGQNSFGVFNEFILKNAGKAIQMFESASKEHFSLSEFNLGRISENKQKYEDSIQHYDKAIKYENVPLIFHNHLYYDDKLEVSKSFVVCYSNLKLCLQSLSQNDFVSSQLFFINALFKPIFKFLFNDDFKSYSFEIKLNQSQDKSLRINFLDFIINFPLYNISNNENNRKSFWKPIDNISNQNKQSKTILIHFDAQHFHGMTKNDDAFKDKEQSFSEINEKIEINMKNFTEIHDEIEYKMKNCTEINDDIEYKMKSCIEINDEIKYKMKSCIEINDEFSCKTKKISEMNEEMMKEDDNCDLTKIGELNNIFNYYNTDKKFKQIFANHENDLNEFIIKKIEDNDERKLKYPMVLFDYISKNIKNMKNDIETIINEMRSILFTPPYSILFGRIKPIKSETHSANTIENIDNRFYSGFE